MLCTIRPFEKARASFIHARKDRFILYSAEVHAPPHSEMGAPLEQWSLEGAVLSALHRPRARGSRLLRRQGALDAQGNRQKYRPARLHPFPRAPHARKT